MIDTTIHLIIDQISRNWMIRSWNNDRSTTKITNFSLMKTYWSFLCHESMNVWWKRCWISNVTIQVIIWDSWCLIQSLGFFVDVFGSCASRFPLPTLNRYLMMIRFRYMIIYLPLGFSRPLLRFIFERFDNACDGFAGCFCFWAQRIEGFKRNKHKFFTHV